MSVDSRPHTRPELDALARPPRPVPCFYAGARTALALGIGGTAYRFAALESPTNHL